MKQGEVVGIPSAEFIPSAAEGLRTGIGRNGAGKSMLLKILSRITRPTRGRAEIRGRVDSLLEACPERSRRGSRRVLAVGDKRFQQKCAQREWRK